MYLIDALYELNIPVFHKIKGMGLFHFDADVSSLRIEGRDSCHLYQPVIEIYNLIGFEQTGC